MSDLLSKPLKGQVWVFTGEIESVPHYEARSILEERGASVEREVTEFTDFLVVGKKPGKKLETAKLLGVELVQCADFKRKVIGETVAANRKRAARLAGDIAKHDLRMVNLEHGLDLAQSSITQAWYEKKHGKVGGEKFLVGPNKGAEPFKTETVCAETKSLKPTFLVVPPRWTCLLAAAFCLAAIIGAIL